MSEQTETLRRAASLMRERATYCAAGVGARWHVVEDGQTMVEDETGSEVVYCDGVRNQSDAEHIASWHPAVALAVADWLDLIAAATERDLPVAFYDNALTVARAYLGESA